MSSKRMPAGLSSGIAVLGLLIEEPDDGYGLERRLAERFGAAEWAPSTGYNALERLRKQGKARVIAGAAGVDEETEPSARTTHEATEDGVRYFWGWLQASLPAPAIRDEMHAKIKFCRPRDLPRMIAIVQGAEQICARRFAVLQRALPAHEEDSLDEEWSVLMMRIVMRDEAASLVLRVKQLERLRVRLEGLRDEAARRAARTRPRLSDG